MIRISNKKKATIIEETAKKSSEMFNGKVDEKTEELQSKLSEDYKDFTSDMIRMYEEQTKPNIWRELLNKLINNKEKTKMLKLQEEKIIVFISEMLFRIVEDEIENLALPLIDVRNFYCSMENEYEKMEERRLRGEIKKGKDAHTILTDYVEKVLYLKYFDFSSFKVLTNKAQEEILQKMAKALDEIIDDYAPKSKARYLNKYTYSDKVNILELSWSFSSKTNIAAENYNKSRAEVINLLPKFKREYIKSYIGKTLEFGIKVAIPVWDIWKTCFDVEGIKTRKIHRKVGIQTGIEGVDVFLNKLNEMENNLFTLHEVMMDDFLKNLNEENKKYIKTKFYVILKIANDCMLNNVKPEQVEKACKEYTEKLCRFKD